MGSLASSIWRQGPPGKAQRYAINNIRTGRDSINTKNQAHTTITIVHGRFHLGGRTGRTVLVKRAKKAQNASPVPAPSFHVPKDITLAQMSQKPRLYQAKFSISEFLKVAPKERTTSTPAWVIGTTATEETAP